MGCWLYTGRTSSSGGLLLFKLSISVADPDLHLRGGGRTFEGLTIDVKFCRNNSSRSKKMRHFHCILQLFQTQKWTCCGHNEDKIKTCTCNKM